MKPSNTENQRDCFWKVVKLPGSVSPMKKLMASSLRKALSSLAKRKVLQDHKQPASARPGSPFLESSSTYCQMPRTRGSYSCAAALMEWCLLFLLSFKCSCKWILQTGSLSLLKFLLWNAKCLLNSKLLFERFDMNFSYEALLIKRRYLDFGLPRWLSGWRIHMQFRRCGFNARIGTVPWRRAWLPTPPFIPGGRHGQRSLTGCSP